ncbi:MAG TPA: AMP-binding protein [Chthoniobacteraceae bacterium]|nr:AMP-binding protein [Chthoniobacteraceae bacterium]
MKTSPHPQPKDRCSPSALKVRQLRKLRRYLRRSVAPFSAHYGELFRKVGFDPGQLREWDDLQRIPMSGKADFSASPDAVRRFVLVPDRAVLARRPSTIVRALFRGKNAAARGLEREFRPLLMTSTTGRSADPVPFLYTAHDIANLAAAGDFVMRVCAADRDDRMMNLFPFAPHLAFWVTHYAGTEFGVSMVSTGGGKTMGTGGNLRLMKRLAPNVLIGMPTFLYHLLKTAADEGLELPGLKKIVLGGEKAPVGIRRRLRRLAARLGAPEIDVLSTYGFTEAKLAWTECPCPQGAASPGYHLTPDLGIIEIIDPVSGEPMGEGEPGEIVFTPLDARGSVVLRYRTGDVIDGGLVYEPCPCCGRSVPRLVGGISRLSEVREMRLDKLKGTLVDFNLLERLLDDTAKVGTWQLELRKRHDDPLETDEIHLHVERLDGVDEPAARRELETLFASRTEIRPNAIHFHDNETMRELQGVGRELKESRIVDHRPPANGTPPATPQPREMVATTGEEA